MITMIELDDPDIVELRCRVEHRQPHNSGSKYKRVLLVAGPLDGVSTQVDASHRPGALIGWATDTKTVIVLTMYQLGNDGVWRFEGFETREKSRDSEMMKVVIS